MSITWKKIPGLDDKYDASNTGKIRSHKTPNGTKLLSIFPNTRGYNVVGISINGKSKQIKVARCVAKAFVPNSDNKPEVNHINGDKTDDRAENLEWCTKQENVTHALKNGLIPVGEDNYKTSMTNNDVIQIRNSYRIGFTLTEIANSYDVTVQCIYKIVNRISWKHI